MTLHSKNIVYTKHMDKIQLAVDWNTLKSQLEQKITHFSTDIKKDLYIMFKNTDELVNELSILEVDCRRFKKPTKKFLEKLEQTNNMITDINKMITMGALL